MADDELLTTAEACRTLGMSWHTFARWCERLEIAEPSERHPYDLRLRMVRMSTVEQIRQARSEMPVNLPPVRVTASPARPAPARRPQLPPPSESPPSASEGAIPDLPDGYVTLEQFCRDHGVPRTTAMQDVKGRWRAGQWKAGRNETGAIIGGPWHVERSDDVQYALDADGRRSFVVYWAQHCASFHSCENCPHT